MSTAPSKRRSSVLTRAAFACLFVGALTASAEAQVLQAGDIVVGGSEFNLFGDPVGGIYRLRGGSRTLLANSVGGVSLLMIDQQGRVVYTTVGSVCGANFNNIALNRLDPETGQTELLACFPYIATPANIPPGLPEDATSLNAVRGLHETRSLRITIDDDVNGGTPQVSTCNAYGLSIAVARSNTPKNLEAFRYVDDEAQFEAGISLEAVTDANDGALMVRHGGATYYSNGTQIGRAGADLRLGFNLKTKVFGNPVSFGGSLRLQAQNELVIPDGVLDNTRYPNSTFQCGPIIDDNVPEGGPWRVFEAAAIGFVNGSLCAVSGSTVTGVPYMFSLTTRAPFLNAFISPCQYWTAVQHYGPYDFFADPPGLYYSSPGNTRIISGDDVYPSGKVWSLDDSGYQVLDSGLIRPRGAASYPPSDPGLTSAALVIRIDSGDDGDGAPPVNLMLVDRQGRRLGRQWDGTPVNDFGERAASLDLGPNGRIRVLALIDPVPGRYSMIAVGTGQGTYEVRGYMGNTAAGGSTVMRIASTGPGLIERITANVALPVGLTLSGPKTWIR